MTQNVATAGSGGGQSVGGGLYIGGGVTTLLGKTMVVGNFAKVNKDIFGPYSV